MKEDLNLIFGESFELKVKALKSEEDCDIGPRHVDYPLQGEQKEFFQSGSSKL